MQALYFLQLLAILACATALACWCGWALARLALPEALAPYRALLAAPLGYALALVVGYWGVRTVFGLWLVLPALLLGAGALNLLAWRRGGRPRPLAAAREHAALLVLLLATLLVGLAPLLSYGHPAVIDAGWDTENYLPTARYLERGPVAAIASARPNPLRDINAAPPRIGLTLGFSVWQGFADLLTGAEALTSFAPLLAWLRALGVLGVFVLLRATLGLRRGPALLGAAWVSAGSLLLWVSFFNFGMQLAAWPLIPLGLVLGAAAVEALPRLPRARAVAVALACALALAALPIAYYPALTLWAPLATGLGLAMLLAAPSARARLGLVGAALAVLALAVLLAALTIVDYGQGFDYRYSNQLTTLGLFRYIPLTDIAGLTRFELKPAAPASLPIWALAGGAALAAAGLAGLAAHPQRLRLAGLLAGVVLYLAWLRWWQAYPYAYMKGAAYATFGLFAAAAAGWEVLERRVPARLRAPAQIAPLLVLGLMAANQANQVAAYWGQPALYARELPALLRLRELVPAGSSVTFTSNSEAQGPTAGLAAYLLDHAVVWGNVHTGYTASSAGAPDAIGEYGLLALSDDPRTLGYREPIWRGGPYLLYQRPPGVLAHLHPRHELAAQARIRLAVGAANLQVGDTPLPGGEPRALELQLAALAPSELLANGRRYPLPAGASLLRLVDLPTPRVLELQNVGAAPITLMSATLRAPGDTIAGLARLPASALLQASASAQGQHVDTTVDLLLPDSGPVTLALDIWDRQRGRHYGWYGLIAQASPSAQRITLALDLPAGSLAARAADGAEIPVGASFEGLQPGQYSARLVLAAGWRPLLGEAEVFSFAVADDGTVGEIRTSATPLSATRTDRPLQELDAQVGAEAKLHGYALGEPAQPGRPLGLTLWWQVLADVPDERSVMVQLRDAAGREVVHADGAPAAGSKPTSTWRAGDLVLDAREIALPADLPPGEYTLVLGMYRWPSLERLPLAIAGARQPEDILSIPVTVEPAP